MRFQRTRVGAWLLGASLIAAALGASASGCSGDVLVSCNAIGDASRCEDVGCVYSTIDEICLEPCREDEDCPAEQSCEEVGVDYVDDATAVRVTTTCIVDERF